MTECMRGLASLARKRLRLMVEYSEHLLDMGSALEQLMVLAVRRRVEPMRRTEPFSS